jgi:hypothetical protein
MCGPVLDIISLSPHLASLTFLALARPTWARCRPSHLGEAAYLFLCSPAAPGYFCPELFFALGIADVPQAVRVWAVDVLIADFLTHLRFSELLTLTFFVRVALSDLDRCVSRVMFF